MVETRTNPGTWGLFVDLDRASPTPAHVQLEVAIRDGIRTGRLKGESIVPSSRRLAQELGLSRGVAVNCW